MLFLLCLIFGTAAQAHPFDTLATELSQNPELVDVSEWPNLTLELRYATPQNFTHHNIYGPFHSCFLHREAAAQLRQAIGSLRARKPGWKMHAFDCLRPVRAQVELFSVVQGTPEQKYVLDPAIGSLHSYGFAIDISLEDENGKEVDMGTPFDFFGIEAEPRHEPELLRDGRLSGAAHENRVLLRAIMAAGGFHN